MRLTSGVNAHLDFRKMKSTYGCNGKEKSCASSLKPLGRPSKCFKIVGSRHTYICTYLISPGYTSINVLLTRLKRLPGKVPRLNFSPRS